MKTQPCPICHKEPKLVAQYVGWAAMCDCYEPDNDCPVGYDHKSRSGALEDWNDAVATWLEEHD